MIKKFILLVMATLFSLNTMAQNPVKILHFTVDVSQSYGEIFAYYDDKGDIEKFRWLLVHPQDPNEPNESDFFTVQDVRNGTVFKKGLPAKFVKVRGENFSAHNGGDINIRVPKNILLGRHTYESATIDRLGDKWIVNHKSRDNVTKVHLTVKTALGLPIGIKDFQFKN